MKRRVRPLVNLALAAALVGSLASCTRSEPAAGDTPAGVPHEGAYVILQGEPRLSPTEKSANGAITDVRADGSIVTSRTAPLAGIDLREWAPGRVDIGNSRGMETWSVLATGDLRTRTNGDGPGCDLLRLDDGTLVRLANIGDTQRGYLTLLQQVDDQGNVTRKLELPGYLTSLVQAGRTLLAAGSSTDTNGQVDAVDLDAWTLTGSRTYPETQNVLRCRNLGAAGSVTCVEQHLDGNPTYADEGNNRYIASIRTDTLERTQVAQADYEVHSVFAHAGRTLALTTEGIGVVENGRVDIRLRVGSRERQAVQIVRNGDTADVFVYPPFRDHRDDRDDTTDLGEVIRADLNTLTEVRRTPLRVPDRPTAQPMIIPKEFFQGASLQA